MGFLWAFYGLLLKYVKIVACIVFMLIFVPIKQTQKHKTMKAQDLKVGSIVEIRLNLSSEQMNHPVQVVIERCTEKYLWFKSNHLQRIGRNTFDTFVQHFGYKIISL